jgi:hypothetical protein
LKPENGHPEAPQNERNIKHRLGTKDKRREKKLKERYAMCACFRCVFNRLGADLILARRAASVHAALKAVDVKI